MLVAREREREERESITHIRAEIVLTPDRQLHTIYYCCISCERVSVCAYKVVGSIPTRHSAVPPRVTTYDPCDGDVVRNVR